MKVEVRQSEALHRNGGLVEELRNETDLLVLGLYEGGKLPMSLLTSGAHGSETAKGKFKEQTLLRPDDPLWVLIVGLGKREDVDPERLRVAAAVAAKEAVRLEAGAVAWALPETDGDDAAAEALVAGTILGSYSFDRFKGGDSDDSSPRLASLTLLAPDGVAAAAETSRVTAEAQNRARDLQMTPANVATPSFLAGRAEEIAATHDAVTAEVLGPEQIAAKGMGGLVAVSRGSAEPARLIVLRYAGNGGGPTLGLVGKGVTFDTGGISLKPGAGMHEMKYDMTGGAVVLESVAAIAELGLAANLVAVVPTTENMPSGTAVKPGDVITQYNGKTVEVNNTDAEGRLILADALAYAIELGAERVVDIATLTGAVTIALGSSFAGVIANDDALAAAVSAAGERSGELVWRLPLHPEFKELMKGKVADLSNLAAKRKAGTITAASFLEEFVGETPWAHIDIAGTAWDVGRAYTGSEASGFGVRLLVELARHRAG
jgi:leucyl aminopeptidase